MSNNKPNIGWLYFREYYRDLENGTSIGSLSLKNKNESLFNQSLPSQLPPQPELPNLKTFQLAVQYPGLLAGTGLIHDLKNEEALKLGFSFDYTTGLPYLPASQVKGMLRSWFPGRMNAQLQALNAKEEKLRVKGESLNKSDARKLKMLKKKVPAFTAYLREVIGKDLSEQELHQLEDQIFEGRKGPATDDGQNHLSLYHRDLFFDAFPVRHLGGTDASLMGPGVITPHTKGELKNPVPIKFLKVMPQVVFEFRFVLHDAQLNNDAHTISAQEKCALFRHYLSEFGIGAKTNVGFGQLEEA